MSPTQLIGGIYVGDIDDVREGDTSQFDVVVGVCQDNCSDNVACPYHHFKLADGPNDIRGQNPGQYSYELLSDAIDRVVKERIQRQTVLVHCHVGCSRSPTVAIAAMAVVEGMSWDEAFERATDQRPIINPGPTLMTHGQRYVEDHQ